MSKVKGRAQPSKAGQRWLTVHPTGRNAIPCKVLESSVALLRDQDGRLFADALREAIGDGGTFISLMNVVYEVTERAMTTENFFGLLRRRSELLGMHGDRVSNVDLYSILWRIFVKDIKPFMGACAELAFVEKALAEGKALVSIERMPFENQSCDFLADEELYEVKYIPPDMQPEDMFDRLERARRQLDITSMTRTLKAGTVRHIALFINEKSSFEFMRNLWAVVRLFQIRNSTTVYEISVTRLVIEERAGEEAVPVPFDGGDETPAIMPMTPPETQQVDIFPNAGASAVETAGKTPAELGNLDERYRNIAERWMRTELGAFSERSIYVTTEAVKGFVNKLLSDEIPVNECFENVRSRLGALLTREELRGRQELRELRDCLRDFLRIKEGQETAAG